MVLCTLQRSPASEYSVLVLTPRGDRVPSSCKRRARSQCVVGAREGTVARFTFAPGDRDVPRPRSCASTFLRHDF